MAKWPHLAPQVHQAKVGSLGVEGAPVKKKSWCFAFGGQSSASLDLPRLLVSPEFRAGSLSAG